MVKTVDKQPNGDLQYVAGVSWPKSVHHLVGRILRKYFGKRFRYCEFYGPKDCCKQFPCARQEEINLSKNHDHEFELPQDDSLKYLIQYREFAGSVVSNFELHIKSGDGPDTALEFRRFVSKEWANHRKFIEKWVTSEFARTHLVMDYQELTSNPTRAMRKIIKLFAPKAKIRHLKLAWVVRTIKGVSHNSKGVVKTGRGVKETRALESFRHYDPQLFFLIEHLKLTREAAIEVFKDVFDHEPEEAQILELQCSESKEALRRNLQT